MNIVNPLKRNVIIELSTADPCYYAVKVMQRISGFSSWFQGVASDKLIKEAQKGIRDCIYHLLITTPGIALNGVSYDIDVSKIYFSKPLYDHVVGLYIPEAYKEYFPIEFDKNDLIIKLTPESFVHKPFGWWKEYINDPPKYFLDMYETPSR